MEKTSIDCDIKPYKEIQNLTAGPDEDYAAVFLLDYKYIKNHYRLIAVDVNRHRELGSDPRAIQQIELVGQLKNLDETVAANECTFVLTI